MMRNVIMSIFLLTALASLSFADQAAWLEKSKAESASKLILPGAEIRMFCAPCDDGSWQAVIVKQVSLKKISNMYYQVLVNEKPIDLAYIYIQQNNQWMNMARVLGLPVVDVPDTLGVPANPLPSSKPETRKNYSIDQKLSDCIEKDNSTLGMIACLEKASEMWDAEMDSAYKQLEEKLSDKGKKALKISQSEWLNFRDRNFDLIKAIYSGVEGTVYGPMRAEDRMNIIKDRVLELKSYMDLFKSFD